MPTYITQLLSSVSWSHRHLVFLCIFLVCLHALSQCQPAEGRHCWPSSWPLLPLSWELQYHLTVKDAVLSVREVAEKLAAWHSLAHLPQRQCLWLCSGSALSPFCLDLVSMLAPFRLYPGSSIGILAVSSVLALSRLSLFQSWLYL